MKRKPPKLLETDGLDDIRNFIEKYNYQSQLQEIMGDKEILVAIATVMAIILSLELVFAAGHSSNAASTDNYRIVLVSIKDSRVSYGMDAVRNAETYSKLASFLGSNVSDLLVNSEIQKATSVNAEISAIDTAINKSVESIHTNQLYLDATNTMCGVTFGLCLSIFYVYMRLLGRYGKFINHRVSLEDIERIRGSYTRVIKNSLGILLLGMVVFFITAQNSILDIMAHNLEVYVLIILGIFGFLMYRLSGELQILESIKSVS